MREEYFNLAKKHTELQDKFINQLKEHSAVLKKLLDAKTKLLKISDLVHDQTLHPETKVQSIGNLLQAE